MRNVNVKVKKGLSTVFTASMLISFCVQPGLSKEIEALSDTKKKAVTTENSSTMSKSEFEAPLPEETTTSSTSKWLLVGGVAAVGVGLAAVALGSSGSSGGDSSTPVEPAVPPVGPDIAGKNWAGTLTLVNVGNEGAQNVTAVITQSGESVTITTDSNLAYGRYFNGHISSGGYLTVRDSTSNKVWTTHFDTATTTAIHLYDWVNDSANYDTLFLTR